MFSVLKSVIFICFYPCLVHPDDEFDLQQATAGAVEANSGDITPPTKHKGKLSKMGKFFKKPWKWKKKKPSDKFTETSKGMLATNFLHVVCIIFCLIYINLF